MGTHPRYLSKAGIGMVGLYAKPGMTIRGQADDREMAEAGWGRGRREQEGSSLLCKGNSTYWDPELLRQQRVLDSYKELGVVGTGEHGR